MNFHLICVHPYKKFAKGQKVTDPEEVNACLLDRGHHFVKIVAPAPADEPETPEAE